MNEVSLKGDSRAAAAVAGFCPSSSSCFHTARAQQFISIFDLRGISGGDFSGGRQMADVCATDDDDAILAPQPLSGGPPARRYLDHIVVPRPALAFLAVFGQGI